MKIDLISYVNELSDNVNLLNKKRLELTIDLINSSTVDLILFSGHTIGFVNDIEELKNRITNTKTEVIFELKDINSKKINNCLYRIKRAQIQNMYTHQLFTESYEIEGNYQLAEILINELETKRSIKIKNKKFVILQCGELNILKNLQKQNNKVEFRLSDDKQLKERFHSILENADIILNPIHTPMGNQGKMLKRREFLTKNKKYYFSTSNTSTNSSNLNLSSIQYAFCNQKKLNPIHTELIEDNFIRRTFDIE